MILLKKYSVYLRSDQIDFLRSLDNASSFVRESLDQFVVKSDRTQAEKTICLYEGARELELKIKALRLVVDTQKEQSEKFDKDIQEAEMFLRLAQKIAKGQFEIEKHGNKFRALIKREDVDRFVRITEGDTEEGVRAETMQRCKQGVKGWKKSLDKAKQKKKAHQAYMKAQKQKLRDMQTNLQKLYVSTK